VSLGLLSTTRAQLARNSRLTGEQKAFLGAATELGSSDAGDCFVSNNASLSEGRAVMLETNIPGFTAEVSLHRTANRYRGRGAISVPSSHQGVLPADTRTDCVNNCYNWYFAGLGVGLLFGPIGAAAGAAGVLGFAKCVSSCPSPDSSGPGLGGDTLGSRPPEHLN
jgi:hypothetical protein